MSIETTAAPDDDPVSRANPRETPLPAPAASLMIPLPAWQAMILLAWIGGRHHHVDASDAAGLFCSGPDWCNRRRLPRVCVRCWSPCCRHMGIRSAVGIRLSNLSASPSVCGLLRPVSCCRPRPAELDSRHLKAILLHELAHVKRADLWVSFLQTILQIVYLSSVAVAGQYYYPPPPRTGRR